jgi:molecular chaperone DnaJ
MDPSAFVDFADILGDFFGFPFGSSGGRRGRQADGEDLKADLTLTFEEAAFGAERSLPVHRHERCEACRATGGRAGSGAVTCRTCRGRGRVQYRQGFFALERPCPECRGQGERLEDPCPECRGEGRVVRERTLTVAIPAGVDSGSRLRLTGEGSHGRAGGPPGDLYVVLEVEKHDLFRREGFDVIVTWGIPFPLAALGGSLEVPTLHGPADLEIPPGTAAGKVFTLRGKGIPRLDGRGKGDEHVLVTVRVPKKLSHAQRQAIEKLADVLKDEPGTAAPEEKGLLDKLREFLTA